MIVCRQALILAPAALLVAATPVQADFISAPDVVVYADPAIGAALRAVGADFRARTGVPVRILTAPGTLLLGLLQRGTRNDVLVTLTPLIERAATQGLVTSGNRAGPWQDPVVLAARDAAPNEAPVGADALARLLGEGRLAVVDPVAEDRMDGPAIVERLGWTTASGRIDGMASGQDVAEAVASGAARLGLLLRSDLGGRRGLVVVGVPQPAAAPAARFAAAIGRNALSRHTAPFIAYLTGPEASERLRREGLEAVT